ncbi:MAG: CoB--CoM heterodisulfide reductase subunit B [Candidatus Geothermarchaeales archaeon]
MSSYALFLGCLIPCHLQYMEVAARKALEKLDVELVDMPDAGCCPEPVGIQALDQRTWLALAARNLCIAESLDLDILTLCSGCYETLKAANMTLRENPGLKEDVNGILSHVRREFKGKIEVKHVVEVLYEDVGLDRISETIQEPLNDLRVAVHYGCHLLRPSNIIRFDDPERPTSLDELVEATGARSTPYVGKMLCCGVGVKGVEAETSFGIARSKLLSVGRAGADCMVVVCPFCMTQYDLSQPLIQRAYGETYDIPVLYYPELLCLAMGVNPEDLGLGFHRVSVDRVLDRIRG